MHIFCNEYIYMQGVFQLVCGITLLLLFWDVLQFGLFFIEVSYSLRLKQFYNLLPSHTFWWSMPIPKQDKIGYVWCTWFLRYTTVR